MHHLHYRCSCHNCIILDRVDKKSQLSPISTVLNYSAYGKILSMTYQHVWQCTHVKLVSTSISFSLPWKYVQGITSIAHVRSTTKQLELLVHCINVHLYNSMDLNSLLSTGNNYPDTGCLRGISSDVFSNIIRWIIRYLVINVH